MNITDLPATIATRIRVTPTGCWEWTGALTEKGYGQVYWDGTTRRVHRVVWELLVGEIPEGLELHHRCEFEACCNPLCLEVCTTLYNVNQKPGVNKSHCLRGHELTPETTPKGHADVDRPGCFECRGSFVGCCGNPFVC